LLIRLFALSLNGGFLLTVVLVNLTEICKGILETGTSQEELKILFLLNGGNLGSHRRPESAARTEQCLLRESIYCW